MKIKIIKQEPIF